MGVWGTAFTESLVKCLTFILEVYFRGAVSSSPKVLSNWNAVFKSWCVVTVPVQKTICGCRFSIDVGL